MYFSQLYYEKEYSYISFNAVHLPGENVASLTTKALASSQVDLEGKSSISKGEFHRSPSRSSRDLNDPSRVKVQFTLPENENKEYDYDAINMSAEKPNSQLSQQRNTRRKEFMAFKKNWDGVQQISRRKWNSVTVGSVIPENKTQTVTLQHHNTEATLHRNSHNKYNEIKFSNGQSGPSIVVFGSDMKVSIILVR